MTKILTIDDKQDNLISMSAILKSLISGCTVITARSGPEGIEKAKIELPDTILLDIKMPDMDGYEVCKRLKEDKDTSHVPVIMISAILTGSHDLIKGLDTGADAYLSKPIDEHVLIAQVKTALRIKTAEDALRRQKNLLEDLVNERTAKLVNSNLQLKHEIDERRRGEEALRESKDRFMKIFEESPLGIALIGSLTGHIYEVNLRYAEIVGRTREEMVSIDWMSITHPDDVPLDLDNMSLMNAGKIPGFSMKKRYLRPGGSIVWVNITVSPVKTKAKTERLHLAMVEDITKQKRDEEERKKIQAKLMQVQKLESIGTLAGGVAHEINNPINGIMNYAQLIKDSKGDGNSATEFAGEIIQETKRISTIVRNMLTFARDEKEGHSPAKIKDIVDSSMSLIQVLFKRDQISLETDVPEELPKIKCRSQQIQQVVMNLVTNARDSLNEKYAEYDENKIVNISSTLFQKDGKRWIRTTIEDHGEGIPQGVEGRIFDPFFTTKPKEKGTGLGLSISYGIVKDHHGELSVESEPGVFTRFHMDLPVDNGWDLEKKDQD